MKVNQIASILNTLQTEIVGSADVLVTDDLSNIVEVGKTVLDYTGTGNENYDNYMGELIDQIGKIIFVDRVYTSQAPNILKDSWEYGSIMMKVRATMADGTGLPDAVNNSTWALEYPTDLNGRGVNGTYVPGDDTTDPVTPPSIAPSPLDPFVLSKPSVEAKFYNRKVTYEVRISLAREQLKEAFRSASEMSRFFSMIENRIQMKRTLCTDALIMATIRNLICNRLDAGVNLLALYNTATYGTGQGASDKYIKAAEFFTTPDAIRFANKTIALYKKYMASASTLYNKGDYVTFTPADRLKAIFLSEYVKDAEVYLYADAFHNEFDKLNGYEEVAYWQGTGDTQNDLASRASIKGYYMDATTCAKSASPINDNKYIIAVLFDEEAAAVCCENDRVTSIYNPRAEYTNYFYKWDANYMNDVQENCVVFYVEDPTT